MGERLFSGWGVRTLAEGEGRYNPIGYHVGTVWPFDNSFIAWGLRRYGFKDEAARIAAGILDAAEFFDGRLPEAFGGYPRALTRTRCSTRRRAARRRGRPGRRCCYCAPCSGSSRWSDHLVVDPALPPSDRPAGAARHPRALGSDRCVRARSGRRRPPPPGCADTR